MNMNIENTESGEIEDVATLELRNRNIAQINLAFRIFGNEDSSVDDETETALIMDKWTADGYAERLDFLLKNKPDIKRRLLIDGDMSVIDEIEKAITTLH